MRVTSKSIFSLEVFPKHCAGHKLFHQPENGVILFKCFVKILTGKGFFKQWVLREKQLRPKIGLPKISDFWSNNFLKEMQKIWTFFRKLGDNNWCCFLSAAPSLQSFHSASLIIYKIVFNLWNSIKREYLDASWTNVAPFCHTWVRNFVLYHL